MPKMIDTPVLERMLAPVSDSLNEEAARQLLSLKADRAVQIHVAKLAEKCNEGLLTPEEQAEYESLVTADSVISILEARARFLLSKKSK
jgi:hypothetical protein